jgi:hypothetical protein
MCAVPLLRARKRIPAAWITISARYPRIAGVMLIEHGHRFTHRDDRERSTSTMTCSHALRGGMPLALACGLAFHVLALSGCGDDGSSPVDPPDGAPPPPIDATLDDDAELADLRVSRGTLNPVFAPHVTTYQLGLSLLVSEIVITPTASSDVATITVNGAVVPPGATTAAIPLALGENQIAIQVTAEAGNVQSYALTVTRTADAFSDRYVKPEIPTGSSQLGASIAINGEYMAVGVPFDASGDPANPADASAPDSGAVYVFRRDGATWVQDAYLKAANAEAFDNFGARVAVSGDTVAVAAPNESSANAGDPSDNGASESGAVYVFRKSAGAWQEEAYLKAANIGGTDGFGSSVALDGDVLAVGAPSEDSADPANPDSNALLNSGAAYVFRRTGASWQQEAYLKASNLGSGDALGAAIALDGDVLVVGATGEDSVRADDPANNGALGSGAAYVFRATGATWQEEAYLKAENAGASDAFGSNIAVDGDLLVIGAPGEASGDPGRGDDNDAPGSGAAYVFQNDGAWTQIAYLKTPVPAVNDAFGASVALAAGVLAVGAPGQDRGKQVGSMNVTVADAGVIYLYLADSGTWLPETQLGAEQFFDASDGFGASVALTAGVLAVGAPFEDSGMKVSPADNAALDSGAVYLFE